MRQQYLVLLALVMCFALLAALAFCSTEDGPPGQTPTMAPLQQHATDTWQLDGSYHVATSCGCTPLAFNAAISIAPTENSPALAFSVRARR